MLGRTPYPPAYIEACHARFTRLLKAFDKAGPTEPFAGPALVEMVLGLETAFVHRLRKREGKDGNPLNEVRMIVASVLEHGGVTTGDSTIQWAPATSVTGLAPGDAFIGEIADRYGAAG